MVAIPFVFTLLLALLAHHFNFNTLFAQIEEGANQEMPLWSSLLILSNFKIVYPSEQKSILNFNILK